ncbi:MAG: radical SAM protein, partial [Myxococcales bacterium]|nr:radical SAM protein [Myxococcales bacterium]
LRGIDVLRAAGVQVTGCIVLTRKNASAVGAILRQMRARGIRSVALSRFSPAGYAAAQVAELLPSRSELLVALEQAEAFALESSMRMQVTMPVPACVLDTRDFPHLRFGSCPVGTEMQEIALGPSGEIRHCTLHREALGDLRAQSLPEILGSEAIATYRDVHPEFCAPCPLREGCLGGCRAAAASTLGDPAGLDPFVAQHVDPAFAERLLEARERGVAFVPLSSLRR